MAALSLLAPLLHAQFPPLVDVTAGGIPVMAQTTFGNVTGRYNRATRTINFYGIPVGKTTAGKNRFRQPVPPEKWDKPKETIVTVSCLQYNGQMLKGTEDCMTVDVVAPVANDRSGCTQAGGNAAGCASVSGQPVPAAAGTYATQVWIYGGGFSMESFPAYQLVTDFYAGGSGPESSKIVSAFAKYRVSMLGFMSHPSLRIEKGTYSGNYGMYDVLNDLRWVSNNIGYFGGDSKRVTVHGESAGATMTGLIFASELTYAGEYAPNGPLITGAAMQSLWQVASNGASFSQKIRDVAGDAAIVAVGCSTSYATSTLTDTDALTKILDCLQTDTTAFAAKIQANTNPNTTVYGPGINAIHGAGALELIEFQAIAAQPCVDGYALSKAPIDLWKDGSYGSDKVSIIVGQNADEESIYYGGLLDFASTNEKVMFYLIANYGFFYAIYSNPAMNADVTISDLFKGSSAMPLAGAGTVPAGELNPLEKYYSGFTDKLQQQVQIMTDGYFAVNHNILIDTLVKQKGRKAGTIFKYVFAEPNRGALENAAANLDGYGVPHTLDMTYTWGYYTIGKNSHLDNFEPPWTPGYYTYAPEVITMGDSMKAYWSTFFRTGSPAAPGLPEWKAVHQGAERMYHTMFFQSTVPYGAMLDPCTMVTACKSEPALNWRVSETLFWQSGFKSTPPRPTCDDVKIGFSHVGGTAYSKGCLVPHGCASWCNPYVCGMYPCESCKVCMDVNSGKFCAGWCNKWTSGFKHCTGCK